MLFLCCGRRTGAGPDAAGLAEEGLNVNAPELCYIIAAIAFALEALPMFVTPKSISLIGIGLFFVAAGLALQSGLAVKLGLDGNIF